MPSIPTTTMRLDEELKESAKRILEELGLNLTSATTLFLRAVVRNRGLPFELKLDGPLPDGRDYVAEYLLPVMSERNRLDKPRRSPSYIRRRLAQRKEAIYSGEEVAF